MHSSFFSLCRGSAGNPSVSFRQCRLRLEPKKNPAENFARFFGSRKPIMLEREDCKRAVVDLSGLLAFWASEDGGLHHAFSSQSPPDGGALGRAAHEEKKQRR